MLNQAGLTIDPDRFSDLSDARATEWLVTNGRGGFAMASVCQMLTRRYHGVLVAAVNPPVERYVLLAKLDATATVGGLTYELATNDYPEAVHPQGYRLLSSFSLRPFPTWRWRAGTADIEQSLCMVPGEDTVFIRYRLAAGVEPVVLTVRPLCTSRHFHHLMHYQEIGPPTVAEENEAIVLSWAQGRPSMHLSHNGEFKSRPDWYYRFALAEEAQRGYDFSQDLFNPGVITGTLRPSDAVGMVFAASTGPRPWTGWKAAFSGAAQSGDPAPVNDDPLVAALQRAAADFIVQRGDRRRTVIAGYPWFGDWGRDTFISLPGLCLATGRYEDARSIIDAFSHYVSDGLIPNRFPDYGEAPEYNTADATLWYIHAIDRYLSYSGDWDFIADRMFDIVAGIIDSHERGTRMGIGLRPDGLLAAGELPHALTWMDARVNNQPVTPRIGKPVEINALWYNALMIAVQFAKRRGDAARAAHWRDLAGRCGEAFGRRFWNASRACLYDVVDPNGAADTADGSVRPNQLLSISLTHPVLDRSRWRAVVEVCRRELWTPLGLRTLERGDPNYRGQYQGDVTQRDYAYHQGTVWPWLLGPFVTAYVRAHGESRTARDEARTLLAGLMDHLSHAGLGGVSEVAGGDAPHRPGGCPWQAWSVAEPLRCLCEDVRGGSRPMRTGEMPRPAVGVG